MVDFYGTVVGAASYHSARGNAAWAAAASDAVRETALLIASEWIDGNFRDRFPGEKTGDRDQVREWPRQGAYDDRAFTIDDDETPGEIERATYEAAYREILSPGSLSVDVTMGENIQSVSVAGAVALTYRGASTLADTQVYIPIIGRILAPILTRDGVSGSGLFGRSTRI